MKAVQGRIREAAGKLVGNEERHARGKTDDHEEAGHEDEGRGEEVTAPGVGPSFFAQHVASMWQARLCRIRPTSVKGGSLATPPTVRRTLQPHSSLHL